MAISVNQPVLQRPRYPGRSTATISQGFVMEDEPMPGSTLRLPDRAAPPLRAASAAYDISQRFMIEDEPMPGSTLWLPDRALGQRAEAVAYEAGPRFHNIDEEFLPGVRWLPDQARAAPRAPPSAYDVPCWFQTVITVEFENLRLGQAYREGGRAAARAAATAYQALAQFVEPDEVQIYRHFVSAPAAFTLRAPPTSYHVAATFVVPDITAEELRSSFLPERIPAAARAAALAYGMTVSFVVPDVGIVEPSELLIGKLLPEFARAAPRAAFPAYETYCRVVVPDAMQPLAHLVAIPNLPARLPQRAGCQAYWIFSTFNVPENFATDTSYKTYTTYGTRSAPRSAAASYWVNSRWPDIDNEPQTLIQQYPSRTPAAARAAASCYVVCQSFEIGDEVQTYRGTLPERALAARRPAAAIYWIPQRYLQIEDENDTQSVLLPARTPAMPRPAASVFWVDSRFRLDEEFLPLPGAALPAQAPSARRPGSAAYWVTNATQGALLGEAPPLEIRIGRSSEMGRAPARPAPSAFWHDVSVQIGDLLLPAPQILPVAARSVRAAAAAFQIVATFVIHDEVMAAELQMLPQRAPAKPRAADSAYRARETAMQLDEPLPGVIFLPQRPPPGPARAASSTYWIDNRIQTPEAAPLPFCWIQLPVQAPAPRRPAAAALQILATFAIHDEPQMSGRLLPDQARAPARPAGSAFWHDVSPQIGDLLLPAPSQLPLRAPAAARAVPVAYVITVKGFDEEFAPRLWAYLEVQPRYAARAPASAYWVGLLPPDFAATPGIQVTQIWVDANYPRVRVEPNYPLVWENA